MRWLVTGGAGFLGSNFIRYWLTQHSADEVVTLDALTYAGVRATVQELEQHPRHRFIQGDICDPAIVEAAMRGCDGLVHFAAETHVDRSITNGAPFLRTNVEGVHVLLRCAQQLQVKRVIHLSTDEVYGPILAGSHAEDAPLNPRSPYAASKAAGDFLVRAYGETYGLAATIIRPTNAYGPRQFPEKFIPLCLTNALDDKPLPLYGDGLYRRNWLFVEDFCRAIERIIESGQPGAIYNVSGASELTNLDVAKMILRLLAKPPSLLQFVTDRPGHDRRYAVESTTLRGIGWHPRVTFEDGLRMTIEWYQTHLDWWQPLTARLREDPYHWLDRTPRAGARQTAGAVF